MVKSKDLKLMRKRLEKAEKIQNPLTLISKDENYPFAPIITSALTPSCSINTEIFTLEHALSSDLLSQPSSSHNTKVLEQCLKLFETNMGDLYRSSSWGLDLDQKRNELEHPKAHFLLASLHSQPNSNSSMSMSMSMASSNEPARLAAFVHFRYEYDDADDPETTVLYVYEIQVAEPFRRQGLGRKLMAVVEYLASAMQLTSVVLTVFVRNEIALRFYRDILNYQIDTSSPSRHGEVADYEILSKKITSA